MTPAAFLLQLSTDPQSTAATIALVAMRCRGLPAAVCLLEVLEQAPEATAPLSVLSAALEAAGLSASRASVRRLLDDLRRLGLPLDWHPRPRGGAAPEGYALTCPRCAGIGALLPGDADLRTCPACCGTGRVRPSELARLLPAE